MNAFEPFVCDHAAFLAGKRPWDVSRDARLLFEAHRGAIDLYGLKSCMVGVDIYNVEAEALGCEVEEPEGCNMPSINRPMRLGSGDIMELSFDPGRDGRLPIILETASRLKGIFPGCDVRVPVCGPFSLAGHLLGIEQLLYDALGDGGKTGGMLLYLASILIKYVRAACDRRLGVTIFESTAAPPLLSPSLFETLVSPALRCIFEAYAARTGENPALVMGGNTLPIAGHLLALAPSFMVCPIETDQRRFMMQIKGATFIRTRVAMDPVVFNARTPERALADAERALALARLAGDAPIGLLLPYAANPAVVMAVNEFCKYRGSTRP